MAKTPKPTVKKTGLEKNPWVATSADFLNVAYGQTKESALRQLSDQVERRRLNNV